MGVKFLSDPLLCALLDENIDFYEVMNAFNIKTHIAFNLSAEVHGFVYVSRQGSYFLVLNGNINYETQCKTFVHEVKHIIEDLPNMGYIIGIDMQHTELEDDLVFQKMLSVF